MKSPDPAIESDGEEPGRGAMRRALPTALSGLLNGVWGTSTVTMVTGALHGLFWPALVAFLLIPLSAVAKRLWRGDVGELADEFAGDVAEAVFCSLRRLLHVKRRRDMPRRAS
jgi:hypothetical protein